MERLSPFLTLDLSEFEASEIAERIISPLTKYLFLESSDREKVNAHERADMLHSVLGSFTLLGFHDREKMFLLMQEFIMSEVCPAAEGTTPVPTINTEVITILAGRTALNDLAEVASHLRELQFYTNEGDILGKDGDGNDIHEATLFKGTYTIVELNPKDGSVKAYATETRDGGIAHTSLGGLERYALIKALFGHHLALAQEQDPAGWTTGTNIWDNKAYGEYTLKTGHAYVGNGGKDGRIGVSGAEMNERWVNDQGGNLLDNNNQYKEYFLAGAADQLAANMIEIIRANVKGGRMPAEGYYLLPSNINIKSWH